MGFTEFIKTTADYLGLSKEVRMFNGAESAVEESLPFAANWMYLAELGLPRPIDYVEVRKYAKSAWIQMIVNYIIKKCKNTPWDVVVSDEEDKTDYSNDIENIKQLLKYPNKSGDKMWDVFGPWLRDVLEIDQGVIHKGRNVLGELVELTVHDGSRFLYKQDEHNRLLGMYQYAYKFVGSKPKFFEINDLICTRMNLTTETYPYGFSPLQSVVQEIEVLIQSTRYNKEFFKNNAIPSGIVFAKMSLPQLKKYEMQWWQQVKGKAHKLLFHNAEVDFKNISSTNKDMEWLDGQKWYFHIPFAVYGVSPQAVGFYENSNRSTGESQSDNTDEGSLVPYLSLIEDTINFDIIADKVGHDKIKFKFINRNDAASDAEHTKDMQKLDRKMYTINEMRQKEGLSPVPWGDVPYEENKEQNGKPNINGNDENNGNDGKRDNKPSSDSSKKKSIHAKTVVLLNKIESLERAIKKESENITEEDATDYADFLKKEFKTWEKEVIGFLDSTIKDEITEKEYKKIDKSLGEFLARLSNVINTSGFKEKLKRVISLAYKTGIKDAEEELNMDIGVSLYFEKQIIQESERQLDGFTMDTGERWDGIKGVSREVEKRIRDIVQKGISDKESIINIKNSVKDYMTTQIGGEVNGEVTEGRSMKIARTETNRMQNKSKLESYKRSRVVKKKKWDAYLDNHTSDICKRLDGQEQDLDKPFIDPLTKKEIMHPPALPHCRSIIKAILK